ncbi:MAG: 30S ribosomal protein S20 [Candidatus Nanopelagicaceae bacterium]|nr:30S ribosomal protein S20 [Candidatus Nanopelagicaceae bacterium]
MANIKSQIKRIRTNNKAQDRNKAYRSALRTAIRRFRDAISSGDAAKIKTEFNDASRSLDMAVSKGVIHANNAANKKSAMAKLANKAGVR